MNPPGILVVEDDEGVSQLLRHAVPCFSRRPAYFAETAEEALDLWHSHQNEIDTLLTDLSMPGLSGEDLAVLIAREKPNLKVIISTGHSIEPKQIEGRIGHQVHLLRKPFDLGELRTLLMTNS